MDCVPQKPPKLQILDELEDASWCQNYPNDEWACSSPIIDHPEIFYENFDLVPFRSMKYDNPPGYSYLMERNGTRCFFLKMNLFVQMHSACSKVVTESKFRPP